MPAIRGAAAGGEGFPNHPKRHRHDENSQRAASHDFDLRDYAGALFDPLPFGQQCLLGSFHLRDSLSDPVVKLLSRATRNKRLRR